MVALFRLHAGEVYTITLVSRQDADAREGDAIVHSTAVPYEIARALAKRLGLLLELTQHDAMTPCKQLQASESS